MIQELLRIMYQFESKKGELLKKGSPGEIWTGFRSSRSQIFLKIAENASYNFLLWYNLAFRLILL